MTQEEKQLLLIDLCARLPYGVRVKMEAQTNPYSRVEFTLLPKHDGGFERLQIWLETGDRYLVQPYLRPMSTMTEEEENEYNSLNAYEGGVFPHTEEALDWLNENHFDYRGLISMGLALEAPECMYKTK